MPLYEYQCDACAHRFEVIQKFSDAPIDVCPKCGGAVTKLLSSPAIQFKGSGWYITDYARKSATQGGSKGESSGAAAKGESKGESKTDTKSGADTSSSSTSSSTTPAAPASKVP
jgi:putative FmdB family regulatory protein